MYNQQQPYQPQQPYHPQQPYPPQQPQYPQQPQHPSQPRYPQQPQQGYGQYQPSYQQPNQQGNWYVPQPATPNQAQGKQKRHGQPSNPQKPPKKKRPSILWQLIKLILIVGVLGGISFGGYFWKVQNEVEPYLDVFLDNVVVDGIDLSGMTLEEGSQAVWAQVQAKQDGWYVRLKSSNGVYNDITAETLGISFDPTHALEQAWAVGHEASDANPDDVFTIQAELESVTGNAYTFASAQQSADVTPIDTILSTLELAAYIRPQDAEIIGFNPDDTLNPFTYQEESYGQRLDTTLIKQEILTMVQNLESGEILLETTVLSPAVTVADLEKTVTLRYVATTDIASYSAENRNKNIQVALERINGIVLEPGDSFSFNTSVGNRTTTNGFFEAIEYAYGQEVMGVGGGVCQVSTTVYLAALQAGLDIVQRYAHSSTVSYTDIGLDATVSDTKGRELDLVFKNNTDNNIYISTRFIQNGTSTKDMKCEVRIYGMDMEGITYEATTKVVETLAKPTEPVYVEDTSLEHVVFVDETELYSKGREGWVVEAYLLTYQDGVEIGFELLHTDTIAAKADYYYVGTLERDTGGV